MAVPKKKANAELPGKKMGKNITADMEGDILVLRIDLTQNLGLSNSGKSEQVATSNGNLPIPFDGFEDIKIGINVYKPV